MNEYTKKVLQARNEFIKLNFEQEKELYNIYNDAGNKLIGKILNMTDSRTKTHNIETYKVINEYRTELYNNLNKTIESNIYKSSDIQNGIQLSFVDVIAPNVEAKKALERTVTKISSDSVKQLIAGEYYKDGKTLSQRVWNLTGDNGNKIDALIKDNIAKGANVKELAKELDQYVNPKNRITAKSFAAGIDSNKVSYQSQRLARTSITHAQTETMIQNAKRNPFSKGLKWNLSASHSARMHGKTDMCDDYNGRIYKPNEVPLQHPNCLCYFTEVIDDINDCIESMKAWSNGNKNSNIDEWINAGDDKTSLKVKTPDSIQTKLKLEENKKQEVVTEKKWSETEYTDKKFTSKKQMSSYLQENYDIKFSDSRKNPINKDILQDSINWLDRFHNYFEGFKEKDPVALPTIKIKNGISSVGYYSFYTKRPEAVELVLNAKYFHDKEYNMRYIKECIESEWTVKNAKGHKTFVHEYGHHIANSLKWLENKELDSDKWSQSFINDVLLEYNKKYKKNCSFKDVSKLVSRYGGSKPGEAFAETFAEYFGGDNPREFAQVFGEKVEKAIKKYIGKGD